MFPKSIKFLLFLFFSIIPISQSVDNPDKSLDPSVYNKDRKQEEYPEDDPEVCGGMTIVDNVCCASYCDNVENSLSCDDCGGESSEHCKKIDSFQCRSGDWGHDYGEIPNDFHYSRSTHFGVTIGGACGFGFYQVCGSEYPFVDEMKSNCEAFCKAFPALCQDPEGISWRGNFAAPPGNYYSQFWGSIEGDRDNYLSCGECFEVYKTKEDGSDYKEGEEGYTPPVILSVVDSCPCRANVKWCCGPYDRCEDIKSFKYGCPLPEGSIHLDLSDIAMARLQVGRADQGMKGDVIPTKYRRVPCPRLGNMYIWLRSSSGPYYICFSIVNSAGWGAITIIEIPNAAGEWVKMIREPNFSSSRPQERYGIWVAPPEKGPYNLPLDIRITDGSGQTILAEKAIKSFEPPANVDPEMNYIDIGVNFPEIPYPDPPSS